MSDQEDALPALPPGSGWRTRADGFVEQHYTTYQMHAYARAAVAAYREDAERLEWLATRSMYAGRAPLADGTRVWFTPEIDFVCVKPDANALRAAIDSARGKGQAVPKLKVCTCGDRNGPDYCEVHAA